MKKFVLEVTEEKKEMAFKSRCEGFNCLEILGILERKKTDIMQQMEGLIKPDFIKREYVEGSNGKE